MKWDTKWWGITITAENEKDEELLRQLKMRLPEKVKYVRGKEGGEGLISENVDEESEGYQLVFDIS